MHSINITWIMQYILFIKFEFGLSTCAVHLCWPNSYGLQTRSFLLYVYQRCSCYQDFYILKFFSKLQAFTPFMYAFAYTHTHLVCLPIFINLFIYQRYAYYEDFNFLKLFMGASSVSYGHRKCTSNKCNCIV